MVGLAKTLPNGLARDEALRLLALYDARVSGGYRNQVIAARDTLARRCGMGVRELRKWLAENEPADPYDTAYADGYRHGLDGAPKSSPADDSELNYLDGYGDGDFRRCQEAV